MMQVFLLTSCQRHEDLVTFVNEVNKRPPTQIEPFPSVKIYPNYAYSSSRLRSPFQPPSPEMKKGTSGNGPDMNRTREPLEAYPLDSLRLVGAIQKKGILWALILDKNGMVHWLTTGHYLGQNYGKIDKILENKIELTEMVVDSQGRWQPRATTLNLLQ